MRFLGFLALAGLLCRAQTGVDAIRASDLRADLTFLTSQPLQGRMSLQRGSEVAIQWIASEFAKAGLVPAAGGSFLQRVPLIEYRPDRESSSLTVRRGASRQTLRYPDAFGMFPDDVTVNGALAFAGYGITAPELHYDDLRGFGRDRQGCTDLRA